MPFILRIDVDKPFGNSTFPNAVRSKLSEDYWYPKNKLFNRNYLNQLAGFLEHCNKEKVQGYFYFRICTIPDQRIINLLKIGGHKAGVHAENTRNFDTFKAEFDKMRQSSAIELDSFSKHGSGKLKLGKHHYPPYEPDKYIEWAARLGVDFRFGNDLCSSCEDFSGNKSFYPKIFWIEREYRDQHFSTLEDAIECAKNNVVPLLIHPSNYASTKDVREDFTRIVALARENNIDWIL